MADQTQVDRIKAGFEGWNAWRKANPEAKVDLSRADLSRASLFATDLTGTDLYGVNLTGARR
ncbi:MAG: pentapeptide repeat-containing protein [Caldilinea sp.]